MWAAAGVTVSTCVSVSVWVMTTTPERAGVEAEGAKEKGMLPVTVGPEIDELPMDQTPDEEAPEGSEAEADGTPLVPTELAGPVGRTVVMVIVWFAWPGPPGRV